MEIYEKINRLISMRNMTKREFSRMLRARNPTLKSTGEIPSEKTIYKYLDGTISLPIELISCIAEVLNISEQELFDNGLEAKLRFCKYIMKSSSDIELKHIHKCYENGFLLKKDTLENADDDIKRLFDIIEFAPKPLIRDTIKKIEKIKNAVLN